MKLTDPYNVVWNPTGTMTTRPIYGDHGVIVGLHRTMIVETFDGPRIRLDTGSQKAEVRIGQAEPEADTPIILE